MIHVRREEAFVVHLDAEGFYAKGGCGFERRAEGVFFGHHVVAPIGKHTEGDFEGGCGADC